MRWLALLALVIWAAPAAAQTVGPAPIVCNRVFQVSQAATALARIVASGGKQISICGWVFNSGAAASTAQLEVGTGTNCGTGTTALTPAISLPINGTYADHVPNASVSLGTGVDLCLVTTGTGPTQVMLYYGVY